MTRNYKFHNPEGAQIINRYSADGQKLYTDYFTKLVQLAVPIDKGAVYSWVFDRNLYNVTSTYYVGNMEYSGLIKTDGTRTHSLQRVHNPEGYTNNFNDTYMSTWFFYYRRDHLGNTREVWRAPYIVYAYGNRTDPASVVQRTQYYASGLPWSEGLVPGYQPYKYNGKEFIEMNGYDISDYGWRGLENATMRFNTVDPHAENYYSISPYVYVANNPIRAIDDDGRDIIVLNNPNGAYGYGHMGVLVGNDKTGWTFISKTGRNKTSWYSKTLIAEATGGPAMNPLIATFKTKAAFDYDRNKKGSKYKGYTQEVRFGTSEEQDKAAASATEESANSWYNFMFSNCADAVSDGLVAAGLDPGYTTVGTSIDDNPFSAGNDIKTLNPRPTERFKQIVKNNKGYIAKEEDTKRTEGSSQTWNQSIATINTWLQQYPNIIVTVK